MAKIKLDNSHTLWDAGMSVHQQSISGYTRVVVRRRSRFESERAMEASEVAAGQVEEMGASTLAQQRLSGVLTT